MDRDRFVDSDADGKDRFTSSLPAAKQRVTSGDLGLFISVGAGSTVGCAIYRF
jgi:hypothetical protein